MTPAMRSLEHAVDVIAAVRRRLEQDGGVVELNQLAHLSVDELDLLVARERRSGCASSERRRRPGTVAA